MTFTSDQSPVISIASNLDFPNENFVELGREGERERDRKENLRREREGKLEHRINFS